MILVVNYSIGPYHASRFKALQDKFGDEVVFVELASKNIKYSWVSLAEQVRAVTLFPGREFSTIPPAESVKVLTRLLDQNKPEVVITVGYATAPMRSAAYWAHRHNAISIGVIDSWKGDKPRFFFKELFKGVWCRMFYNGLFISGFLSKSYYQNLGFPAARIWLGQDCVDNDYFSNGALKIRAEAEKYRSQYQLPKDYFLCASRLSQEKNPERLLKAFSKYKSQGGTWKLVMVGSGPLEEGLHVLADHLRISEYVRFMGWKQVEEMPVFYGLASSLILPSISEAWGLVVNEAMASGLPILISNKCGCQPELCFRGINGFDFNPYNEPEITEVMLKISSGSCNLKRMGQASMDLVQRFSPANYAESLSDCIQTLRNRKISRS